VGLASSPSQANGVAGTGGKGLAPAGKGKLGPKFFGPFKVLERVNGNSYRVELPADTKLHDVFHIGLLKSYQGVAPSGPGVLPTIRHGCACLAPTKVIKSRLTRGHHDVLVQWTRLSVVDASWVDLDEFRKLYPAFQLEDELVIEGGRDIMWGLHYSKRGKQQNRLATTGTGATDAGGSSIPNARN
jgi:hypothetical protein